MENKSPRTCAIILAAGSGSRMNMDITKQTLQICGKSVLKRSLESVDDTDEVSAIVVVYRDGEYDFVNKECQSLKKPFTLVKGGKTRAESAALGFYQIPSNCEYVMIHDSARCLVTPSDIKKVLKAAYVHTAATASSLITDTLKRCDEFGKITETLSRDEVRAMQTPQAFSRELYARALEKCDSLDSSVTDDNMLVERIGVMPYCVQTCSSNIKITSRSDIDFAEYVIKKREALENE